MRVKLLLSALVFAPLASAQQPTGANETTIWNAYQNLRNSASIEIQMNGTEAYAGVSTPLRSTLYWKLSYDARTGANTLAQAELDIYDANSAGGSPSFRIVGDGTSLYRYDINRREVSTTTYGFFGSHLPDGYKADEAPDAHRLLAQMRTVAPGPTAYLIHLLTDLNPVGSGSASRYTSWDPGTVAWNFDQVWDATPDSAKVSSGVRKKQYNIVDVTTDDVLVDPLTLRPYTREDTSTQWFFYRVNQASPSETMAVKVTDAIDNPTFAQWTFTQKRGDRVLDLSFTPTSGAAPSWAFVPYVGAQASVFRPVAPRSAG